MEYECEITVYKGIHQGNLADVHGTVYVSRKHIGDDSFFLCPDVIGSSVMEWAGRG